MSKTIAAAVLICLVATGAVTGAIGQTNQETVLMQRAQLYQRTGDIEEANKLYTQVLTTDAKNYTALDLRSLNFFALGQNKEALDDANRCVTLHPSQESLMRRSAVLEKMGRFEPALVDLDRCLKPGEPPNDIEYIHLLRSLIRMLCGRYSEARTYAYAHQTLVPRSILSFELSSVADALCALPADSISNLTQFNYVKVHGGSELHNSETKIQYSQWPMSKLHSPAELKTHQFQCLYATWSEGDFRQGALKNRERLQLLATLAAKHKGLSPAQYHFARAIIYFYQQDYDHSLAEAAQSNSGNMQLYSQLVTFYCHLRQRAIAQAGVDLDRLTSSFPDSPCVLEAVDLYHYESDKRQDGIAQIKTLLAKNPKNEAALAELAKIYRDLSQADDSLRYCNLALQLNPKDASLLPMKANILTSAGRYAEALKILSTVLVAEPQNGAVLLERAGIYTQQRRWSKAIDDLSQAIKLKYDLVKAYRARAACYGALDQPDRARHDLIQVKAMDAIAAHRSGAD